MKSSCQDYLAELRGKIHQAEDNLRSETKNLYKVFEILNEEKDKWEKEFRDEELKIHANEIQMKQKEAQLKQLREDYDEVRKRSVVLDAENEKIRRELQKVKTLMEDKTNKFLLEQGNLEKELSKVQELKKEARLSNKWMKKMQEKEAKFQESEKENQFNERVKLLTEEFNKKVTNFDETLQDIDKNSVDPKRERLRSLQATLQRIVMECDDLEKKNRNLERELDVLKKL